MPQSMLRGMTYTLEVLFSAWAPGKEFKAQQAFRIFGLRHPNVLPMETLVFNCLAISSNTANRKQSSPNRFEQNQHTHDDFCKICGGGPYLNKERALEGTLGNTPSMELFNAKPNTLQEACFTNFTNLHNPIE